MALNKAFVCTDSFVSNEVNVCSNLNTNRGILLQMAIMSVIKPNTIFTKHGMLIEMPV